MSLGDIHALHKENNNYIGISKDDGTLNEPLIFITMSNLL